jgi:hypothetical protein
MPLWAASNSEAACNPHAPRIRVQVNRLVTHNRERNPQLYAPHARNHEDGISLLLGDEGKDSTHGQWFATVRTANV